MRTLLLLFLCVELPFALSCSTTPKTPAEQPAETHPSDQLLTDEQVWDRYYAFIARVKPYGIPTDRAQHEEELKPEIVDRGKEDYYTRTQAAIKIRAEGFIEVTMDGYTGEIRQFCHDKLFKDDPSWLPWSRPPRIKPGLTEKEIRKIGEGYLDLVTGVELDENKMKVRYLDTFWYISAVRRFRGYEVVPQYVVIWYSGKYGLCRYQNTTSSIECDTDLRVSREEARALAEKYIKEVLATRGGLFPMDVEVQGPEIVSLGDLNTQGKIELPSVKELMKMRLVWSVDFSERKPEGRQLDPTVDIPRGVTLYIDAITGKLLGQVTSF